MQLHRVVEYNLFESLTEDAGQWVVVLTLGPLLLGAACVIVPVAVVGRLARSLLGGRQ